MAFSGHQNGQGAYKTRKAQPNVQVKAITDVSMNLPEPAFCMLSCSMANGTMLKMTAGRQHGALRQGGKKEAILAIFAKYTESKPSMPETIHFVSYSYKIFP